MITGRQIRAARALLDISQDELAVAAGLTKQGISKIEDGSVQPREGTIADINRVFSGRGIEFLDDEGVKKKTDSIMKLEGFAEFKGFMDQVYEAALQPYSRDGTKPICVCNVENNIFRKHLKDYYFVHLERMRKLEGVQIRMLASGIDVNQPSDVHYFKYRFLKEMKSTSAPFYVFGDTFALIDFSAPNSPRIILVNSPALASSFRDQFEIMWENAEDAPNN